MLDHLFQKIEEDGIFFNSFSEASVLDTRGKARKN